MSGHRPPVPYGARARAAASLIERLRTLGFNAARLARIGHDAWAPVAALAVEMGDSELIGSMTWCERNPGRPWRRGLVAGELAHVA